MKEINTEQLKLRAATPDDAPFIAWAISTALHKEESSEEIANQLCEICLRKDTLYSWRNTIIAECKGKVAGALTCYDGGQYQAMRDITFPLFSALSDTDFSQMEMETVEGEFYLDSMSVLPEFRKMGIATALLKAGIDRARELAIGKASLVVLPTNEGAKRLYESLGFEFVQVMHLFGEEYLKYSLNLAEETPESIVCLNCGTECTSNFCPNCGQNTNTLRLTMKHIWQNLLAAIISNDGGVIYTIRRLFSRPGKMIKDFIDGHRANIFSPFPMLLLAMGLYVLVISYTDSNSLMRIDKEKEKSLIKVENKEDPHDENVITIANQAIGIVEKSKDFYRNHFALVSILLMPLSICFIRLFYGKDFRKRYNWAETTVLQVYYLVLATFFDCIVSLLSLVLGRHYGAFYDLYIIFGYPLILTWCGTLLCGKGVIRTYMRSFAVNIVGGIATFLVIFSAFLIMVLVLVGKNMSM